MLWVRLPPFRLSGQSVCGNMRALGARVLGSTPSALTDLGRKICPKNVFFILLYSMKKTLKHFIEKWYTIPQIGKELNISESSVRRLLKKHGLRTKRYTDNNPNATHRICKYCHQEKPINEFPICSSKAAFRRWRCNACYVKSKANRRLELRLFILDIKKGKKCIQCGNDDFRVLQFHHKQEKEFDVANASQMGLSRNKILKEIGKCEVLCANCHQIETYEQWQKGSVTFIF